MVEAAEVKEAVRRSLEDGGFEVFDETAWRLVGASAIYTSGLDTIFELVATALSGTTSVLRGISPLELAEKIAKLPLSLQRHFGLRSKQGDQVKSSPRHRAGSPSPGRTRPQKTIAQITPYSANFQESDGVSACLGVALNSEVAPPAMSPRGFNTPTWSAPNTSHGRKQFGGKYDDHMVDNGTAETFPHAAGRKHFEDHTTTMNANDIGTAPITVRKSYGRKYIHVPDHVKADLETTVEPPPPPAPSLKPAPKPVEAASSSHDRAWSTFADSLSQGTNRAAGVSSQTRLH
jgi:hypothetical protein